MKKAASVLALVICGVWTPSRARGGSEPKPTPAPFYRQYLVAGDPLDDKILEQEHRIEASPDDPNLRNDFGNLLAERKFPKQAAEQYEKALDLDKKNFISAYNLGLVLETEGKVSSAISAYQRSIKRKPGFPQSRFRLGRLYEKTNNAESAVHEYAAAMWIDPAMRDPKRNPLIVDCELIYLASLANYQRDVAVASMGESRVYFDNDRFRKLPTNRVISSKEVESDEEPAPAPRDVGSSGAAGAAGAAGASEPARHAPRTPPQGQGRPVSPNMRRTPPPRAQVPPIPGGPPAPVAAPPPAGETVEPTPAPDIPPESAPEPAVTPGPPQEVEPS